VFSPSEGQDSTRHAVAAHRWDYRWQHVPKKLTNLKKLVGDTSLMTYAGHCVLQTLIRSRFSPAFTTGQRYIYTGCATGRLVIYDVLTGKIECELSGHKGCVRDVSWHPFKQEIITTSWDRTVGSWTYSGKHVLDSDDEMDLEVDDESKQAELIGLRRSRRIAERRQRLRQRSS
jgi:WD repeat-containing protein 23